MGAIEFIMGGGFASSGGDLSEDDKKVSENFMKKFGEEVAKLGRAQQIPASNLSIFKMNYLFIGKDINNYHFLFVDKIGMDTINYKNLSQYGSVSLSQLIHQMRMDVGEVHWALSVPINTISSITNEEIINLSDQYIKAVTEVKEEKTDNIHEEAIIVPEIAKAIEQFKAEFKDRKTAFIMMQFSKTKAHDEIVEIIKDTLEKNGIIGLRADDKEYSDELFSNIKVYMHCCDFGIGVFERILEDIFNPNVSIEVGYMMGLRKDVCLLKDQTLKNLPTDLVGKLYKQFDPQDIKNTLPSQLNKWMQDKGII